MLGVAPSGGKDTVVNFNGTNASVTVSAGTGFAKALQAQYVSSINMNADVVIMAEGAEAHGMSVNGYGSSNAMQDGTINVNGIGANFNLSDRTFAYVDLERTTGAEADEKIRYSLGVRHVW